MNNDSESIKFRQKVEEMYHEDPFRLLTLLNRLDQFGQLNKNLIVKTTTKWYLQKTFATRRKVRLLRRNQEEFEAAFLHLIQEYNLMPDSFIKLDCHLTMEHLMSNSSLLKERQF
jgi:hypothetical protein